MPAPQGGKLSTKVVLTGPSFFDTMQIRILLGRPIGKQDTVAAPRVVVVNDVSAKRFFSNRNPVGRRFAFDGEKPIDCQIVGLAKNRLYSSLTSEVPPVAYVPWSQPLDK